MQWVKLKPNRKKTSFLPTKAADVQKVQLLVLLLVKICFPVCLFDGEFNRNSSTSAIAIFVVYVNSNDE